MKTLKTREEIKKFKHEYVYLDNFISIIIRCKKVLESDFAQLENTFRDNSAMLVEIKSFKDAFFFKLDRLLDCFLELERQILTSSFDNYSPMLYERNLVVEDTIKKITNIVDLFFTQFFSLMDIFIKAIIKIYKPSIAGQIDSLGRLYSYLHKAGDKADKTLFGSLIENETDFSDFRDYRDYLIHHGNLSIEQTRYKANEEYYLDEYHVHYVHKDGSHKYLVRSDFQTKLNLYIRVNLKHELDAFHQILGGLRNLSFSPDEIANSSNPN